MLSRACAWGRPGFASRVRTPGSRCRSPVARPQSVREAAGGGASRMGAGLAGVPTVDCCTSPEKDDLSCPVREYDAEWTQQASEKEWMQKAETWTHMQICHPGSTSADHIDPWTRDVHPSDGVSGMLESITKKGISRAPPGILAESAGSSVIKHGVGGHVLMEDDNRPFESNEKDKWPVVMLRKCDLVGALPVLPSDHPQGNFKSMQKMRIATLETAGDAFAIPSCLEGCADDDAASSITRSPRDAAYRRGKKSRAERSGRVPPGHESFDGETMEEWVDWQDQRIATYDKEFNDGL